MIGVEARGAWKELERHLRPYLARRVAPADVDDLLQEVFVRMHQSLAALREEERFGGWVYRIANSAIVDAARRRARARPLDAGDAIRVAAVGDTSEEQFQSDLGECVALFVGRLPSPYREAVTLTELEGLTQREAAEMLGITLSGLKSRVQRGRDKIRHMFDECCQISVDCRGRVIDCAPRDLAEVPPDCRDAAVSWAARQRHS
jgi:RNA polymerase sigma-70 factor (ECF subfamily)